MYDPQIIGCALGVMIEILIMGLMNVWIRGGRIGSIVAFALLAFLAWVFVGVLL